MGWTHMPLNKPVKNWFKEYWESENNNRYTVLDSAIVHFTELYGAIRDNNTGEVFCATFLIHFMPKSGYNFGYKPMTEHVGPRIVQCPKRIFKLLTSLNEKNDENGWAKQWRENVIKYHNRKSVKEGTLIKTLKPVSFVNKGDFSHFRKIKYPHYRNVFEACNNKFEPIINVRLNLKNYDYEIIEN